MKIRWILTQDMTALRDVTKSLELPGGWRLCEARFPDSKDLLRAQGDIRLKVLPALSTAVAKLDATKTAFLSTLGYTAQAGDTVLDALRSLRNTHAVDPASFDISE
jgi:hypothetical protein